MLLVARFTVFQIIVSLFFLNYFSLYFESSPKHFCPFPVLFVSSFVAATTIAISAGKAWMYKLDIALDDNVACSHDIEH